MILFSSSPLATAALDSGQDELELYYFGVKSRRRFPALVAGVLWSYSRCHSRPFPALVASVLCRCCNRSMPRVAGVLFRRWLLVSSVAAVIVRCRALRESFRVIVVAVIVHRRRLGQVRHWRLGLRRQCGLGLRRQFGLAGCRCRLLIVALINGAVLRIRVLCLHV